MLRLAFVVALIGCGGGASVDGSLRGACTKVCTCFAESSSGGNFSGSFSEGSTCVDDCINEGESGSPTSSGASGGVTQECINCILNETCDNLIEGSSCETECDF